MSDQEVEVSQDIMLTDTAVSEIRSIIEENDIPSGHFLRIGVKGGGCSGLSYALGFDAELRESDVRLDVKGIPLVVDSKSLFYLTGTEIDYSSGLSGKGFVFNNPNAQRTCGCGSSFSA